MLEDAGLQNPNELYANGEWTWEKWREYLIALTQDTDGDGVIDVYGFGSRTDFLVQNLLTSNGTYIARNTALAPSVCNILISEGDSKEGPVSCAYTPSNSSISFSFAVFLIISCKSSS